MTDATRTLLQAVLDDPDDLASRRVYADALIAAGDPRGELINVQCELPATPVGTPPWRALVQREAELLAAHGKTWLAPLKGIVWHPTFTRGFLEKILVNTKNFIPAAADLLAREPVTSIHLRDLTQANAAVLGKVPGLARLHTLKVVESKLGARGTAALFSDRLTRLRHLNLYQSGIDDGSLPHLFDTVLPRLERLDLSGTRVTYNGLEQILTELPQLRYLALKWHVPGTDGSGHLAEHLALPSLTHLDLGSNHLSNGDLRHLAGNPVFRKLKGLRLEHNELSGPGAIAALAELRDLEVLDLSTNEIDTPALAALAELPLKLRSLRLYQCNVTDDGLRALAKAKWPLQRLDLGYGQLTKAGLTAIAASGWPLEKLELWACKIGDGTFALADADFARTIREMSLGFNDLTDADLLGLTVNDWPRLERIVFRGDTMIAQGLNAFALSSRFPALRSLKLEEIKYSKAAIKPLIDRGVRIE